MAARTALLALVVFEFVSAEASASVLVA
jgi:hypothetical protein